MSKIYKKYCKWCKSEFFAGNGRYDKDDDIKPMKAVFCCKSCSNKARFGISDSVSNFSETDAAYIAGLIDGEGSIIFLKRKGGGGSYRLVIVNTHKGALSWVQDVTNVGSIHGKTREAQYKKCWAWVCHAQTARKVLERCLPYLIIKRNKAQEAIAYLSDIEVKGTGCKQVTATFTAADDGV